MKVLSLTIVFVFVALITKGQEHTNIYPDHYCLVSGLHSKSMHALASDKLSYYDVIYYHLDLEVTDTSTFINGNVGVDAKITVDEPDAFVLELIDELTVDSVFINEVKHDFTHENDLITAPLVSNYMSGDHLTVTVYYHGFTGLAEDEGFFNQLHNPTGFRVTYTLSEPFAAKSWFPVKQDLQDKADSVRIQITIPENLKAGSNGLLQEVVSHGNGKVTYDWKSDYPIVYYLISLAVANYQEYNIYALPEGATDSILIQNYVYDFPGLLESMKPDIDKTADMLNLFSELYTMYPFYEEKYGHAMAPFGGGMEHQTMTTILDFRFFLVAHEIAHQWFGNNVTCATWQDIWINEGFASYSEYIAIQHLLSQEEADAWMNSAHTRILMQPGGSVYVPIEEADNVRRIFDYRLSYKKGAAILHMLRFEMNDDELFFDVLQEFQIRYKDSTATGDDFKILLEELTNADWDFFFDQWYYGEGYPIYTLSWDQGADSLYIYSNQNSSTDYSQFFKSSIQFRIEYEDNSSELIRVMQDTPKEVFQLRTDKQVKQIAFDPKNWLLDRVSSDSYLRREPVKEEVTIQPNPALNKFELSFSPSSDQWDIKIFSLNGKLVYSKEIKNKTLIEIETHGWSHGVYVVKVENKEQKITKKLVISE